MCDCATNEIAKAKYKDPFGPYFVVSLGTAPWIPQSADRLAALDSWESQSAQDRPDFPPQEVSLQAFSLYRLRFLVAASLCHDSDPFGGLAAQLSHFGTGLPLAVTEHIGIALSYHRVVGEKLQERDRQLLVGGRCYTELLAELSFPTSEQSKREHAISAGPNAVVEKAPHPANVEGKGKKVPERSDNTVAVASARRSRSRSCRRRSTTPSRRRPDRNQQQQQAPLFFRRQKRQQQQQQAFQPQKGAVVAKTVDGLAAFLLF